MPRVSRSRSKNNYRTSRSISADSVRRSKYQPRGSGGYSNRHHHHFKGYVTTASFKYCQFGHTTSKSRSRSRSSHSSSEGSQKSYYDRSRGKHYLDKRDSRSNRDRKYHKSSRGYSNRNYSQRRCYDNRRSSRGRSYERTKSPQTQTQAYSKYSSSKRQGNSGNHGYIFEERKQNVWVKTGELQSQQPQATESCLDTLSRLDSQQTQDGSKRAQSFQMQSYEQLQQPMRQNHQFSFQRMMMHQSQQQQQPQNSSGMMLHPYAHKALEHGPLAKKAYHEPPRLEITPIEKTDTLNHAMIPGLSTTYIQTVPDNQKYKTKIYLPRSTGINYVGLLIGPKGIYQKRLEEQTGCKILIRGRGSHKEGHPMQYDDTEDQHVLIIGETEEKLHRARQIVQRVLTADEETRNAIRSEQLKAAQEMSKDFYKHPIEDFLLTPYGPPSPYAYIIPVPNECVGLIIGKGGETIRYLQMKSGSKIQVAKKEIPGTTMRNVFIEGPPDKFEGARQLIEDIVDEHRKIQENFQQIGEVNPFPGPFSYFAIPNAITDIIIGQNGSTIKALYQKTGAYIFIPQDVNQNNERLLQLSGSHEQVEKCKIELMQIIRNVQKFADMTGQRLSNETLSTSYIQQSEMKKKSLLEQAIKEQQLLLPQNHNFYSSDVKEEPAEDHSKFDIANPLKGYSAQSGNNFTQISQKDFLFDPLAAAYYERFTQFLPGSQLNFNDLKWPALAKSQYEHPKNYKTYYQEYCQQYGLPLQNMQADNSLSTEATTYSASDHTPILKPQRVPIKHSMSNKSQQRLPKETDNFFQCSQDFNSSSFNGGAGALNSSLQFCPQVQSQGNSMCALNSQPYFSQYDQFSQGHSYLGTMQAPPMTQNYSQSSELQEIGERPSALSLFYQCFGPDGALTRLQNTQHEPQTSFAQVSKPHKQESPSRSPLQYITELQQQIESSQLMMEPGAKIVLPQSQYLELLASDPLQSYLNPSSDMFNQQQAEGFLNQEGLEEEEEEDDDADEGQLDLIVDT